jgi:hypothetical protein
VFYEKLIESTYNPDDLILLEEDSALPEYKLLRNFIKGLNPSKYSVRGWDDHVVCVKAYEFYKFKSKLDQAINGILWGAESSQNVNANNFELVLDFASHKGYNDLSRDKVDNYLNGHLSKEEIQQFENKKQVLSYKCKAELERSNIEFIYDNFQQSQKSLARTINDSGEAKRLFVLTGRNHGVTNDARLQGIVEKYFQNMKHSYVVVDAQVV